MSSLASNNNMPSLLSSLIIQFVSTLFRFFIFLPCFRMRGTRTLAATASKLGHPTSFSQPSSLWAVDNNNSSSYEGASEGEEDEDESQRQSNGFQSRGNRFGHGKRKIFRCRRKRRHPKSRNSLSRPRKAQDTSTSSTEPVFQPVASPSLPVEELSSLLK